MLISAIQGSSSAPAFALACLMYFMLVFLIAFSEKGSEWVGKLQGGEEHGLATALVLVGMGLLSIPFYMYDMKLEISTKEYNQVADWVEECPSIKDKIEEFKEDGISRREYETISSMVRKTRKQRAKDRL